MQRLGLLESDKDYLITIKDLEEYGIDIPDNYKAYETGSRVSWLDGSMIIEYEYEQIDNGEPDNGEPVIYIHCSVGINKSESDARLSFEARQVGMGLGELEVRNRDDEFSWGENSLFCETMWEEIPCGMVFAGYKDNYDYFLMIAGFYFEDADMWKELISPHLANLEGLSN